METRKINLNCEASLSNGVNIIIPVYETRMGYAADLSDNQIRKICRFLRGASSFNRPFITMDGVKYTHFTIIYNTLSWWRDEPCA